MQTVRLLLILAAALLLAGTETRLGEAPAVEAAFPGENGLIAFQTYQSLEIATMNSDGTDVRILRSGELPSWSPDGRKIAYQGRASSGEALDVFVMNTDGSGPVNVTNNPAVDGQPSWSPDGKKIVFVSSRDGSDQIWITNANGSNTQKLTNFLALDPFSTHPRWSPDGTRILFSGMETVDDNGGYDLYTIAPNGEGLVNVTNTPRVGDAYDFEGYADWSPDGTKIVFRYTPTVAGQHFIYTMNANGSGRQLLTPHDDSNPDNTTPAWSPDGTRIVYRGVNVPFSSSLVTMDTDGSDKQTLVLGSYPDWQPEPLPGPPIVFIHGFLGSRINCGANELWPNIGLLPPSGPDFPQMMLATNGVSPAPGACNATVGDILDEVLGGSIYQTAIDFLDGLAPDNVSYFNWDWRKSPEPSLALLDAHIDNIRQAHDDQKVVIVAHSYGGLLARWYVDDASRANKVERVVTVGTPAWGSPKALFQLYAGIETPDLSGLDLFMDNNDLYEFSKNLLGDYFLYPSVSYGPWLTLHPSSTALNRQGLLDYVTQLGGNAALLDQALSAHASTLDSIPNGVDFEVIVGAGLPTISEIGVTPDGFLLIDYGNGDGTVPARSAARGVAGPTNSNAAHTHYSCGVGHVDLPGDPQVIGAIEDYLLTGDAISGLDASPCAANGIQFRLFDLPSVAAAAPAGVSATSSAMTLDDAVFQGVIDYLDLPGEKFAITGVTFPEVALPEGRFLQVTPILDGVKGQSQTYGPLEGEISISAEAGAPTVFVDGEPVEPVPGTPHAWGDNDCDGEITSRDNQALSRKVLQQPALSQTQPCPALGDTVSVTGNGGSDHPWGDLDCDGEITSRDGQGLLRRVLNQAPLSQTQPCPPVGESVKVAHAALPSERKVLRLLR